MFTLIAYAHPYCTRNSRSNVMQHHVLRVYNAEALVGILISMQGLNSLKCSVTTDFPLIDHFLHQLSTFYEKLKKICVEDTLPMHHHIQPLFVAVQCLPMSTLKVECKLKGGRQPKSFTNYTHINEI